MKDIVIILRNKTQGQNSIEEIAQRINKCLQVEIISLPYKSSSIIGILKNIIFIRKIKTKVYHIISPTEAYILPFIKGIKIATFHDLGTMIASRNFIYKIAKIIFYILPAAFFSDFITFVSNETLKEFLKLTKFKKKDKFRVIHNFVAQDFFTQQNQRNKANKKFTILHIGTASRKNLEKVIKACRNLDIQLNIVGILSEKQRNLLTKYNIDYKNEYDISTKQIIENYINCDIVTFPSSYEGFGLPVIEANALGKPVIAGDIPVLHEIADNSAIYVNPAISNEIRDAILKLKNNSTFYNRMSYLGLKNSKRFTSEVLVNEYKKLYNTALYL